MKLNKFAYLYSKLFGNHTLKIMKKNPWKFTFKKPGKIMVSPKKWEPGQGGHGTGKTGNLVLTFSRQGKHREFCFDTGKNFETQGKYFSVTQGKI